MYVDTPLHSNTTLQFMKLMHKRGALSNEEFDVLTKDVKPNNPIYVLEDAMSYILLCDSLDSNK